MAKNYKYLVLTKSAGLVLNMLALVAPKKAAAIAYRLHSEPRVGKLDKKNLPLVLEKAQKDLIESGGLSYQTYTWSGSDEIILLVHGWESNSARWELLLPFLITTGKTIVAIDAPAHGLSGGHSFSVPEYAKYIDAICKKINPSYLIGHSIGGAACIFYQYKYQNSSIKKMVILGAPSDLQVLINNFCVLLGLNAKLKIYLTAEFAKQVGLPIVEFSAVQFGAAINTAALIAHDNSDNIVGFDESQKITKNWHNSQFIETDSLGHSMHDDLLYQQITDFILS